MFLMYVVFFAAFDVFYVSGIAKDAFENGKMEK